MKFPCPYEILIRGLLEIGLLLLMKDKILSENSEVWKIFSVETKSFRSVCTKELN